MDTKCTNVLVPILFCVKNRLDTRCNRYKDEKGGAEHHLAFPSKQSIL